MIIRSIKAAGWRCFLDEIAVGPFDEALNIIHAPNGTGKSSLFEAMRRVLLDGHRVSGREVEAIRPWGRQLAPRVTVELFHAGEEYRITKQYLDSPSALLERKEDGRFRRLAEGAAADDQVRQLVTKNPPGRGLARLEHWGVAQVLWAPQGNLAIAPLSGDVVSDIRNMLGAQVSSAGTGPLEKRIEERYLQFFTTKGKLKAGKDAPLLTRLKEQLAEAAQACRNARSQYTAFEEAARRVEELHARRAQVRRDADEITKALRKARVQAEEYQKLVGEKAQRLDKAVAAEAQYRAVNQLIDLIRSTEKDLAEAQNVLVSLENEAPLKLKEVQEYEKEVATRKSALEDARKGRDEIDAADKLAREARQFNDCRKERDRLEELTQKIKNAQALAAECREYRHACVAPDARTLNAIRKAIKDRDEAQVRIEASLITLEIVPRSNVSVDVVAGESPGPLEAKAGVPVRVQGSPEVVADIGAVARVRAWGPAGSIEEHRAARACAEQRLTALTAPFGAGDPDTLDALAEKAKELDARLGEAEAALRALLAEGSLDEFVRQRSVLESACASHLDAHRDWDNSPPDAVVLEIHAKELKDAFIARVESCEDARDKAQSALAAAAGQRSTILARTEDARRRADALNARLMDLARDGKTLPDRETELHHATMTWDAAKARLAEIQDQLARFDEDPAPAVRRLEVQLEAANQEANRARDLEARELGKLDSLGAQGPYSTLVAAEERVSQLDEEARREESRLEAIRLLYDTVSACRAEAIAAVSAPVEASATRLLQRIAGRRLGRIQVGAAFDPAAVLPESLEQGVTPDNLSGGEQEQLYLATRLALAEVLAREERQLVVLDDVLTATDAGRLARVMNVLEEAAERLQVLILSCHPERYRGLKQARFFELEDLAHAPWA